MLQESFRMGARENVRMGRERESELLWCCAVLRKRSDNRCSHCVVGLDIFIALRVVAWAARCNTIWPQRVRGQIFAVLMPAHLVPAVEASRKQLHEGVSPRLVVSRRPRQAFDVPPPN